MRQTLADTAAASEDDRPAAGGDVDMVVQGAAAPDPCPEVPTGVSLSKAQNESLAKMAGERKRQLLQRPCRSPGCNHHRRTAAASPGEQEARALGPASHMEARAPDAHRPRCARLPHSARSSARCAAHRPGTRPDCVQYQSDLRGACGPQDEGKLTKNIVPGCHLAPVFFREPFGVSLNWLRVK